MRSLGVATALVLALSPPGPVAAGPAAGPVPAGGPALSVPVAKMRAAVRCPPAMQGRRPPVLLVHGRGQTGLSAWSWNYLDPLAAEGYDACTVDLPAFATADIQVSAEYVVQAVRDLAAAAGGKVDVLTFSQGALEARWALTWWPDVREAVDDAILLAAPNHGSSASDLLCALDCVAAAWQTRPGSAFVAALDSGDETPGPASWTNIFSGTDELVFHAGEQEPFGPAAAIDGAANIRLQDLCAGRVVGHIQHLYDAQVHRLVLDALAHPGPAEPPRAGLACGQITMPGVELYDAAAQSAATVANFAARTNENKVDAEPPLAGYAQRQAP